MRLEDTIFKISCAKVTKIGPMLLYIIEKNLADMSERRNSIDRTLSDGVYGYQRHVLTDQIKMN